MPQQVADPPALGQQQAQITPASMQFQPTTTTTNSESLCGHSIEETNRNLTPNSNLDANKLSTSINSQSIPESSFIPINETSGSAAAAAAAAATKLNGLKNRIIQRPPPLILDKVSNFYDSETQSSLVNNNNYNSNHIQKSTQPSVQNNFINQKNSYSNGASLGDANILINSKNNFTSSSIANAKINTATTTTSNSANHKFWASLNQNASRARSASGLLHVQQHQQQAHAINSNRMPISRANTEINILKQATIVESDANHNLGPDLIISHRSNNSSTKTSILSQAVDELQRKNSALKAQDRPNNSHSNSDENKLVDYESSILTNHNGALKMNSMNCVNQDTELMDPGTTNLSKSSNHDHSMSNNSELDDSNHGCTTSENGGGNLIGVDNPTPPASAAGHQPNEMPRPLTDEPPVSATSSRPRSNNPFLATDDELMSAFSQYHPDQQQLSNNSNSFHHRPASFMAATDNTLKSMMQQKHHLTQQLYSDAQQKQINNQLCNLRIDNKNQDLIDLPSTHKDEIYGSLGGPMVNTNESRSNEDQRDGSSSYYQPINSINTGMQLQEYTTPQQTHYSGVNQAHQQQQSIYGAYGHAERNNINHEPIISVDSESTVCKPPPMPTMQLSHWTDAIYELNNAILESSSVAGGTEIGQFIYIIESGDIILELDHVKVSGFTLIEFNGFLQSKQTHLLKAVQTKHSHGLTIDLKHHLNSSFPTNSADKELQDLIRENIYRRTIPCTTRPPKEGEIDKVDYHFLTREQFVQLNNMGALLECGIYGGHYYGTMKPLTDLNILTDYGTNNNGISNDMRQPLNASHHTAGPLERNGLETSTRDITPVANSKPDLNLLYENYESLRLHQPQTYNTMHSSPLIRDPNSLPPNLRPLPIIEPQSSMSLPVGGRSSSIVAIDSESLPHGWERVIDQTHGTYYIDHNTQRTQYEMPYEIELTKGVMGFGFTLVEADSGVLLVRSVIPGGPAHQCGIIRPGDILVSAVGVSVSGLQHTDIARLFSTFAIGDRVTLTFARSSYVVDTNLVPDEYLFSNGTNGDLAVAVNMNNPNFNHSQSVEQNPHIIVNQEFEFITVNLKRGDQGFGFTISDSVAGQKVRKIQNSETCTNLKQGDILVSVNGEDVTKMSHKAVVKKLKNCPAGHDVTLTVRRKKRGVYPAKSVEQSYLSSFHDFQNNYYANNEEIAQQQGLYATFNGDHPQNQAPFIQPISNEFTINEPTYGHSVSMPMVPTHYDHQVNDANIYNSQNIVPAPVSTNEQDEWELHQVDLDRDSRDSNWGIRLIGGAEVDRAISIGSIVLGGAASKNGSLKSGDEIISINGYNVVGATHEYVVNLISACANKASLLIRRKKFAEACDVVLHRSMDEGFGFVIISRDNCALIGRIIEGSPAERCQQLHVRDRIIAINGNYITPNMRHPDIVNMIKECGSTLRLQIIPEDCYTVELIKSSQQDNFGFSMRGGSEYDGMPLYILRVAPNGLARDLLNVGDQIIEINGIPTVGMTHQQAAGIIKYSDPVVKLKLRRNYVLPPSLLVSSPKELSKFKQVTAEMKPVNSSGTPSFSGPDGSTSSDYYSTGASRQLPPPPPIIDRTTVDAASIAVGQQ